MSIEIDKITQIIPTQMGNMIVTKKLLVEYDIEDYARAGAEAQARALQMQNVGELLQARPSWPKNLIPSAFKGGSDD